MPDLRQRNIQLRHGKHILFVMHKYYRLECCECQLYIHGNDLFLHLQQRLSSVRQFLRQHVLGRNLRIGIYADRDFRRVHLSSLLQQLADMESCRQRVRSSNLPVKLRGLQQRILRKLQLRL